MSLEFSNLKKRIRTSKADGGRSQSQARITHFIPTSAKVSPKNDYMPRPGSEVPPGPRRFKDRGLRDRVSQAIVAGEKRVDQGSKKSSCEYGGQYDTLNVEIIEDNERQSDTINVK